MAEQTSDGELPTDGASMSATAVGEEEGMDGEIDETEEVTERLNRDSSRGQPSSRDIDSKNKDTERHHTSSDHRRHRHHISSHRNRRRHGRGDTTEHISDHEGRGGGSNGRLKQRTDNNDEAFNPSATNKSSRISGRKHDKSKGGSHSHGTQRSKHSFEDSSEGWELTGSYEDSLTHTKDHTSGGSKRSMKENRDHHRGQMKGMADKGDAEDGEILEDGELSDDADVADKRGDDAGRETFEVSTSKSSSKEKSKDKPERKKSDHKGKRNHETDTKRRKRKNGGMDSQEGAANPAPAWGSGYQGPKKRGPELGNKEQHPSTGTKGYQSPPGLYDSPSYSEDSDEESIPKAVMTEGYIDSSVAADEKEGIFMHKEFLPKKNKRPFERNEYKRGRNSESKFEGPPRKKALVDMNMSDRPACRFYLEGKCAKGSLCQFNHDVEKTKKMEVCKYHLTVKGCIRDKCQYMHNYPCKYYHTGAKCYSGDKCKFSHDPLTDETRRALEMRVAAEDIIDMEDTDYNYAYDRSRDTHNKPSLLGSPPRFRPHGKKIPSLFEIEVHPPGQSSKAPSQTTRPSGFYSETNASPNAGMEHNNTGSGIGSPNMGMMGNAGAGSQGGQHGFANQMNNGNPGLLQAPRPNMINLPAGNGRPIMMMANQQGFQQQRLPGGPSIQFMGPGQMNNNNNQQPQSGNNLPPVLNMLGAIIREAAMQKGTGVHGNNMNMMPNIGMGIGNIRHNMNNMGNPNMNHLNNMGSNNMQQENNNMGNPNMNHFNNMGSNNMQQENNSMGNPNMNHLNNMGSNNMQQENNSMGNPNNTVVQNNMPSSNANNAGPMNIGLNMIGNPGSNMSAGNMSAHNTNGNTVQHNSTENTDPNKVGSVGISVSLTGNGTNSQQKQDTKMDIDERIKPSFEEIKEDSQDLLELDKIRQQIQAQIDREDEGDGDIPENSNEDVKEEQPSLETSDDSVENDGQRGDKENLEKEAEPKVNIEIPSHLPKKQKELFKRIQQQQLLREKEWERQEALKATNEGVVKVELDDWYSSDEDDKSDQKPKLTDVLKKLNKESTTAAAATPSFNLGSLITSSSETAAPSSASTFNIMQMINTIKNQSTVSADPSKPKLIPETAGGPLTSTKQGESQIPHQQKILSPHPTLNSFTKFSELLDAGKPSLHLLPLTVDPPVVSATPVKPMTYTVIKISLNMAKPYTQLPDNVHAPDPAYKDDPRVKWHLNYLEKVPKEPRRKESSDEERPQKQSDPRLKKKAADPRLAQTGDSPNSGRGPEPRAPDLNLHRPQVSVDPRLARMAAGNLDPRLNRQNSQNNQEGIGLINNMGGVPVIGMGGMMGNQMAGSFSLINGPMRTDIEPAGYMGSSPNNSGGGLMNSLVGGGVMGMDARLVPGRGGPMNNAGPIGNNMAMMRGQGNQMGPVPDLLNRMKGLQETGHVLGGDLGNMMNFQGNSIGRGHVGQLNNPPRSDAALLEQRMNSSSSDPRLRNMKTISEAQSSSDPRLKNRAIVNRDMQLNTKEFMDMDPRSMIVNSAKSDVFGDVRGYDNNDFRSFPNKMKGQGDLGQSPNYLHGDVANFGAEQLQTRDNWSSKTDHRTDSDRHLSSFAPSSMQHSKPNEKPAPKFDYRNDPRFRRVNRLAGQQNFNVDGSSSPSNKDRRIDEDGAMNEQFDPSRGSYNTSRTSDRRDPRSRNTLSPQLPDSLEDFDLPSSAAVEPEPDLKVKDHFKAIDPTASPFC